MPSPSICLSLKTAGRIDGRPPVRVFVQRSVNAALRCSVGVRSSVGPSAGVCPSMPPSSPPPRFTVGGDTAPTFSFIYTAAHTLVVSISQRNLSWKIMESDNSAQRPIYGSSRPSSSLLKLARGLHCSYFTAITPFPLSRIHTGCPNWCTITIASHPMNFMNIPRY